MKKKKKEKVLEVLERDCDENCTGVIEFKYNALYTLMIGASRASCFASQMGHESSTLSLPSIVHFGAYEILAL